MGLKIYIFIISMLTIMSCNGERQKRDNSLSFNKAETPATAQSTENGIVEYLSISLEEAMQKAQKEEKLIFIDCSTTTCGPCRMMRKTIFTKKKCSDYINENFIPLHINMDEGEGLEIAEKYNVGIFPTYLILNPDGTVRGDVVGADKNLNRFLKKLENAAAGHSEAI